MYVYIHLVARRLISFITLSLPDKHPKSALRVQFADENEDDVIDSDHGQAQPEPEAAPNLNIKYGMVKYTERVWLPHMGLTKVMAIFSGTLNKTQEKGTTLQKKRYNTHIIKNCLDFCSFVPLAKEKA